MVIHSFIHSSPTQNLIRYGDKQVGVERVTEIVGHEGEEWFQVLIASSLHRNIQRSPRSQFLQHSNDIMNIS